MSDDSEHFECVLCFIRGHPVEINGKLELLIKESFIILCAIPEKSAPHTNEPDSSESKLLSRKN